jgi:hypothetical protein
MVGLGGLEPPTSHLSGAHSNQLSYKPQFNTQGINTKAKHSINQHVNVNL